MTPGNSGQYMGIAGKLATNGGIYTGFALGDDPASATMIGDRGQDAIGARHHRMPFLGALYGYGSKQELTGYWFRAIP